ncbi:ATP-dependent RNA helicase DDX5/DBP2 [Pancytospora epiphaga]|nr:ATP-dependent RNA helicase DDX5/DBP2 [Pancytospora epiphaga]
MYGSQRSSYGDRNGRQGGDRNNYQRRSGPRGRSFGGRDDDFEPIRKENEPVDFEKNFYVPTKTLNQEEAEQLRKKASMRLVGSDINLPVTDFESLGFPQSVVDSFKNKGYKEPTPIQAQGWPMALSGRDMVGIADTGSGKTISFVLPALIHAAAQKPLRERDGPIVLILAPTRELCNQIEEVVAEYASFFNMRSVAVFGGASIVPQKKAIVRGTEILVATPGRLIDLHEQGFCPLGRVTFLVLDEADRMLDMGFEPQLQQIIPKTHPNRQTLMWSATWPREVRRLAADFMKDFIQVTIGDDSLKANAKITQKVEVVHWQDKKDKLLDYLKNRNSDKIIVFCNMKRTCDVIESFLIENGYNSAAIHGDKTQGARDAVISAFKNGRRNILIATDVAARGLDVKDVKLVINYDFPKVIDDYVHRIGRTARGSCAEGLAFTMVCDDDRATVPKLIGILKESHQEVPAALSNMGSSRGRYGGNDNRGSSRGMRNGPPRRYGY